MEVKNVIQDTLLGYSHVIFANIIRYYPCFHPYRFGIKVNLQYKCHLIISKYLRDHRGTLEHITMGSG